jgi:thioesterase domain-containing protein
VDRRALPPPDFGDLAGAQTAPGDAVEAVLVELWKEVLSAGQVGIGDNFFDLGGDSLLASELFIQIDKRFGRLYPLSLLIEKNTIRKLAEVLRDPDSGIARSLVAVKPEGSRPPLFVIPGGYGDVLYLRSLARHVDAGQPVYGLQAAGTQGRRQYSMRMEEIAAQYLAEVAEVQPHGPYLLAGHSFGGYVAVEMARLLGQRGERVALLAMLDTYPPGKREQASLRNRILIQLENLRPLTGKQKFAYVRARLDELLLRLSRSLFLTGLLSRPGSTAERAVAYSRAARYNYAPAPYPGPLTLFKAGERPWYVDWDPMKRWSDYVSGEIVSVPVPGAHESILFEPYVKDLAEALDRRIRQVLGLRS